MLAKVFHIQSKLSFRGLNVSEVEAEAEDIVSAKLNLVVNTSAGPICVQ
jgi:hypothetical protein